MFVTISLTWKKNNNNNNFLKASSSSARRMETKLLCADSALAGSNPDLQLVFCFPSPELQPYQPPQKEMNFHASVSSLMLTILCLDCPLPLSTLGDKKVQPKLLDMRSKISSLWPNLSNTSFLTDFLKHGEPAKKVGLGKPNQVICEFMVHRHTHKSQGWEREVW